MNRPEDIPFEVWDIAFDAMPPVAKVNYETSPLSMVLHLGFARAIMAAEKRGEEQEREACAAISDNNFLQEGRDEWAKGYRSASAQIAEEIRKRGEAK